MSKLLIKKIVFLVQSWGGNSNRDEGGGDSEDAAGRYPERGLLGLYNRWSRRSA